MNTSTDRGPTTPSPSDTRRGVFSRSVVARWLGLRLLAFGYPVFISVTQKDLTFDDPYILMRYGQHLAQGLGWTFNPGSPTSNAVTSPLYVLLTAAGTAVGGSSEVWSRCIYVAAWGLGGLVLARVLFLDGRRLGGWLACGMYSFAPLLANTRGMETSLYLLLILAVIWSFQRQRWLALGCALGLLAMARADACLLAATFIVFLSLRRPRKAVLTALAPFGAIGASWAVTSWALNGSLTPTTLAAKLAQRDSGVWGSQWSFLNGLSTNGIMGIDGGQPMFELAGDLVMLAAVFGTVVAFRRGEHAVPMLAVGAAIVVVEFGVVFRISGSYLWHYGPWMLWAIAGAAVAVDEVVRHHHRVTASLCVAATVASFISAAYVGPYWWNWWKSVRSHYREAAEWIDRDTAKPHPTVAAGEFGAIGYYSRADMIDYLGLLDPKAINSVRRDDFTWWLARKPDYWVRLKDWPLDAPTIELPEFQSEYAPAATIGQIIIYRRSAY